MSILQCILYLYIHYILVTKNRTPAKLIYFLHISETWSTDDWIWHNYQYATQDLWWKAWTTAILINICYTSSLLKNWCNCLMQRNMMLCKMLIEFPLLLTMIKGAKGNVKNFFFENWKQWWGTRIYITFLKFNNIYNTNVTLYPRFYLISLIFTEK